MTAFVWVVRSLLLLLLLGLFLPFELIFALAFASPVAFVLSLLVLAVFGLGIVFALALHVLGSLIDIVLILGLIGIVWKWPRGMRGSSWDKLKIAFYSLKGAVREQIRRLTGTDIVILGGILLVVFALSLSSGLLHFLLTVATVLLVVGIVWKWPRHPRLGFFDKLRLALRELYNEIRRIA